MSRSHKKINYRPSPAVGRVIAAAAVRLDVSENTVIDMACERAAGVLTPADVAETRKDARAKMKPRRKPKK